ncbi:MAG: aminoglycoside phosphotransferase family protein [Alphaproteobacteria bacterium]|nr:aminoglycoside phosphotransferase family protein [Alphaproteobacteria bacterium]
MTEINRKQIDKFFAKKFPDTKPEYIGEGWSSFAFRSGPNIIRVPRKTDTVETYERESQICKFVKPFLSLPVPKTKIVRGKIPYALHRELKGRKFDNTYLLSLSKATRNKIAWDAAKFLAELHSIDCADMLCSIPCLRPEKTIRAKSLKKCSAAFKGLMPAPKIKELIEKYAAAIERSKKLKGRVFCHGDFSGGNSVLNKRNELCGVFDWCNGRFFIPEYDMMRIYGPMPSIFNQVLAEYNSLTGRKIKKSAVSDQWLIQTVECAYYLNKCDHLSPIRENAMKDICKRAAVYL